MENHIKERPILFSSPMIRAILSGAKTQTRRVIRDAYVSRRKDGCLLLPELLQQIGVGAACPYGRPGDRLWVREKHTFVADVWGLHAGVAYQYGGIRWLDGDAPELVGKTVYNEDKPEVWKWRSPIHMPRWASRITLEITDVRVERLQEISAGDCLSEGIRLDWEPYTNQLPPSETDYYNAYRDLWKRINGHGSWESSPWVWVITFKRVEGTDHA